MRTPTRDEAGKLEALAREMEDLDAKAQAELRMLRGICGVPVGALLDLLHLVWVDRNGQPVRD